MPYFTEADQGSLFFVIKGEIIEIIETPESIAGGSAFKEIEQVLNLVIPMLPHGAGTDGLRAFFYKKCWDIITLQSNK